MALLVSRIRAPMLSIISATESSRAQKSGPTAACCGGTVISGGTAGSGMVGGHAGPCPLRPGSYGTNSPYWAGIWHSPSARHSPRWGSRAKLRLGSRHTHHDIERPLAAAPRRIRWPLQRTAARGTGRRGRLANRRHRRTANRHGRLTIAPPADGHAATANGRCMGQDRDTPRALAAVDGLHGGLTALAPLRPAGVGWRERPGPGDRVWRRGTPRHAGQRLGVKGRRGIAEDAIARLIGGMAT